MGRARWKTIGASATLGGLALLAASLSTGLVPWVSRTRVWSIGVLEGPSPFDLSAVPGTPNPVLTARQAAGTEARFVADPFAIQRDGRWHLFFELLGSRDGQGDVAHAWSADGLRWTFDGVVLDEPFHLSYPYVFSAGDEVYMLPESVEAGSVRLYRAAAFPRRWAFARTLVPEPLADPSIVFFQGRWWLFAAPWGNSSLTVHFADRLEGPWAPHALNPVVRSSPHGARPAGRLLVRDGRLYRFAQDDAPSYGRQVFAFEVTALGPAVYAERPVREKAVVGPGEEAWSRKGMHHVDAHELSPGRWRAWVDGSRRAWVFELRRWPP